MNSRRLAVVLIAPCLLFAVSRTSSVQAQGVCSFAQSQTIVGSADVGAGCASLSIASGATLTFTNATRVNVIPATIAVVGTGPATIVANGSQPAKPGAGADGDNYPKWTSCCGGSDVDYWQAVNNAKINPNNGCRGRQGPQGGTGSRGADVYFAANASVSGTLVIDDFGGAPGVGGDGGRGTTMYNRVNNYCNGCTYGCPNGLPGYTGFKGADGNIYVGPAQQASGSFTFTGGQASAPPH